MPNLWDKLNQMTMPDPNETEQGMFDLINNIDAQTTNIIPKPVGLSRVMLGASEAAGPAYPARAVDSEAAPYEPPVHITKALEILKRFEGFSAKPYPDGLRHSIGFGTQEHPVGNRPVMPDDAPIDRDEGEMGVLKKLLELDESLMGPGFDTLNTNQRAAVLSKMFNVGERNFLGPTMAERIREGNVEEAADEFDKWVYAGGKKLGGLVKRRKAEKKLYLTPDNNLQRALNEGLGKDVFIPGNLEAVPAGRRN